MKPFFWLAEIIIGKKIASWYQINSIYIHIILPEKKDFSLKTNYDFTFTINSLEFDVYFKVFLK